MNFQQAHEILETVAVGPILKILLKNDFKPILKADYLKAYTSVLKCAEDEKNAKLIFEYFLKIMGDYLDTIYKKVSEQQGEVLIDYFITQTSNWKILSNWTNKIFGYLDRYYIKDKSGNRKLFWNCMNLYKSRFLNPLKERIYEELNIMITNDRQNKMVEKSKINYVIDVLEYVDIENPLLVKREDDYYWTVDTSMSKPNEEENRKKTLKDWYQLSFGPMTKQYIQEKFNKAISVHSSIEYIRLALTYLNEEDVRKMEYIKIDLHERLDRLNLKIIIDDAMNDLATKDTGFRYMFNNSKIGELEDSFRLLARSGKKETWKIFTDIMEEYIRDEGEKLFSNVELRKDPIKFVPELLKFKKYMDKLADEKFEGNIFFQDCKNKAFSHFMNREIYSRFLALYSDYEMRIGIKGQTEKGIEDIINDITNLFRCLNNKLIFQLEYSKKLSDRLITNRYQSIIAEKLFITKLKSEVGVTFVNKMTSMMQDLDTSKLEMDMYRLQKHRGSPQGFPFIVQILQHGAWEIDRHKFNKIELPSLLSNCFDDFNKYYIGRHKTHKLIWAYGLGTIEIEYLYLTKKYQSVSTLTQINVLLTLEKYETLTVEKIAEILGVDKNLVSNEINSLLYHPSFNPKRSKINGIISSNVKDNEDVSPHHEIQINKSFFTNNLKLNTIPTNFKKTANDECGNSNNLEVHNLKTYRNILIDSNLTRIMKGRIGQKTHHTFLINEVAKQIDLFQAQPPQIKERIECLIEKNILKRNENDRNCYEYVA